MTTLRQLLAEAGMKAQVIGEPPLFDVVFAPDPITDYRGMLKADTALMRRFNGLMRERGVLKGEQKYYVSLAHTPDDVRFTREAWASAVKALAS
jgi:glutamate-1-semialdehyde 2,1-aminomutase